MCYIIEMSSEPSSKDISRIFFLFPRKRVRHCRLNIQTYLETSACIWYLSHKLHQPNRLLFRRKITLITYSVITLNILFASSLYHGMRVLQESQSGAYPRQLVFHSRLLCTLVTLAAFAIDNCAHIKPVRAEKFTDFIS